MRRIIDKIVSDHYRDDLNKPVTVNVYKNNCGLYVVDPFEDKLPSYFERLYQARNYALTGDRTGALNP